MNQLACFYCASTEHLERVASSESFIEKANKLRLAVYFSFENTQIEEQVKLLKAGSVGIQADFLKLTGVIKAHECVVPFLVKEILSSEPALTARPSILAETQDFWFDDIDVWYDFPQFWVNFLRPVSPQAIFDNLQNSNHDF